MEATVDGQHHDSRRRSGAGAGMIVLRLVALLLAAAIGAGISLWSLEAPETVRPWLYEKGTYLGAPDQPVPPAAGDELGTRTRLQAQ